MNLFRRQFAPRVSRRSTISRASLAAPLLIAIAGCGGAVSKYIPSPANTLFSVTPSARTITTNGQVQIKAVTNSGGAAAVKWTIVGGENDATFGEGVIDTNGNYTPPAVLTQDSIQVEVQAQLRSDLTRTATEVISVTPGFLQPLTPENSTLAAGTSIQVSAQLAEVGGGSVDWQLSNSASGARRLGSAYGTFSQQSCQHSPRDYTVCSAVFAAPTTLPAAARDVYVVAAVSGSTPTIGTRQALHILLNGSGVSSTPLTNQSVQTSLVQLGSSGGNNNDADTSDDSAAGQFVNDCCGGTLGALLRDESGSQYILSNNHVLAESDQAKVGDTIVQPALIDRNCDQNAGRPIGVLRYSVPLASAETNVDAALAEVNTGTVDPSGAILQLGLPGAGTNGGIAAAAPAAGVGEALTLDRFGPQSTPMMVAKSGRTTGLTCSTIDAIDLSIEVDYYKDCAETQPYYRKTFAGQIGIAGDGFSDSGDSGALVVDAANAQPLALYFAGGSDDRGGGLSIASPIQDVLTAVDAEANHQFSIVGGAEHPVSCLNYDAHTPAAPAISDSQRKRAELVIRRNAATLLNPATGILDMAAGASADSPGDPAIIVYVDKTRSDVEVPKAIGGIRTLIIPTDQSTLNAGTASRTLPRVTGIQLPETALIAAREVQRASAPRLLSDPAIFGVGVTQSRDNPGEASLLILVDLSRSPRSTPAVIGGLRTRYVYMHRFHVTRSRHAGAPHPSSCMLQSRATGKSTPAFDPEKAGTFRLP